mmetsp:Transcript_5176/g.14925  ORF Transcript_5176/g.14925 Transcript_5176/m.14925 type:complete len:295 (-) Transcript_5176:995-1879(-)
MRYARYSPARLTLNDTAPEKVGVEHVRVPQAFFHVTFSTLRATLKAVSGMALCSYRTTQSSFLGCGSTNCTTTDSSSVSNLSLVAFMEASGDTGDADGLEDGDSVGLTEGDALGECDGGVVGKRLGYALGFELEDSVGPALGLELGMVVGVVMGGELGLVDTVGPEVGSVLGTELGSKDVDGTMLGSVLIVVGTDDSTKLGGALGPPEGPSEGIRLGIVAGVTLGETDGLEVGPALGPADGLADGLVEGSKVTLAMASGGTMIRPPAGREAHASSVLLMKLTPPRSHPFHLIRL